MNWISIDLIWASNMRYHYWVDNIPQSIPMQEDCITVHYFNTHSQLYHRKPPCELLWIVVVPVDVFLDPVPDHAWHIIGFQSGPILLFAGRYATPIIALDKIKLTAESSHNRMTVARPPIAPDLFISSTVMTKSKYKTSPLNDELTPSDVTLRNVLLCTRQ